MAPVIHSKNGNNYTLVVHDYFSKFLEAYGIPDQTAQTAADSLVTEWFCRYRILLVIHIDQGLFVGQCCLRNSVRYVQNWAFHSLMVL